MIKVYFFIGCLFCSLQILAQGSLSGKVVERISRRPLEGVTVNVLETKQYTTTNSTGKFSMQLKSGAKRVKFSMIGYTSRELIISGNKTLDVDLILEDGNLDEVVIVGYGEVTRRDLTGSVGQAKLKDMIKAPVPSFADALSGRVAGVQVSSNDGQPGTLPNIIIRGANSLTQDNSPLYVIDGFPMEGNDNNSINPSDIESIDILKDASATAIYGARGSNGVIIITTKRGKKGAPQVSYNGYYGLNRDVKRLEVLKPYDFVKMQIELNPTTATDIYLTSQGKQLDDYKNEKGINWYDKVLRTAAMQDHSVSILSGSEKSKFALSGEYLKQDGIFVNTGFGRYQGRFTLDQDISKHLKIGLTTNYAYTKSYGTIATNNGGSTSAGLMYSIWGYRPILASRSDLDADPLDELTDPEINPTEDYRVNPLLQLENEFRENSSENFMTNGFVAYTIGAGLILKVTAGMSKVNMDNSSFYNSKTRTGSSSYPQSLGPNGQRIFTDNLNFTNENTLSWTKKIGSDHTFNSIVGYTQQFGTVSQSGAQAIQITNESLELDGLDEGSPRLITAGSSEWVLNSFLGRVNYSFRSKILATTSFRTDGSSKFNKNNRWGYFPSFALAYRFSEETFIKKSKLISDGKFRISYGAIGNNRVTDFATLSNVVTSNSSGYSFGNNVPSRGVYVAQLGNPKLKWETTNQLDIGTDLNFWKDIFSLTADFYYKKTKNLLLNAQLPYQSGYNTAFKNIGSVSNSGFEFSINSNNINSRTFHWETNFNISFNRNKVLSLTENQEAITSITSAVYNRVPSYIAKIGHPIGMVYGLISDGVYNYDDFNVDESGKYTLRQEIPTNGNTRSSIRPGDVKYRDINYDGTISVDDFTIIGDPNPDFIGGFNNNFNYKGFDLNVFLQFSYGNDVLNANRVIFENARSAAGISSLNQYASYLKRWSPENSTSNIPRANGGYSGEYYSSRVVEDASFLRLKTVSIGYTFPMSILTRVSIKMLRLYVSGQNLITWTKYTGVDPEVSTRNTTLTPGFDYSPYPRLRTFVFGLNASF